MERKVYNKNNLAVLQAVSKDGIKPILNAVLFKDDGRVVGTDGLMLIETTVSEGYTGGDLDEIKTAKGDVAISKNDVEQLKLTKFSKAPFLNETFYIEEIDNNKGRVQLRTVLDSKGGVNKRETKKIEGKFPKYKKFFKNSPGELRARIRINPRLLMRMAKALIQFKPGDFSDCYISVRGDEQAVIFETELHDTNQKFRGLLMPMVKHGEDGVEKD